MQWNRWAPALSEQQAEPTSAVSPARSVPPHFAALNQSQISGCKQLRDRESISFASCCRQLPNCQNVEIWSKTSHCSSTCWALAVPQSLSYNSLKLWRGKAWHSTSLCRLKDTWMSQWLSSCNKYSLHMLWAAVLLPRSTHHAPSPGQDDPVVTLWTGGKSTSSSSSVKDFSNNLRWGPQDVSEELPKLAYPPQFPLQQFPTAAGSQCCLTNPRRRSRNTISSPKPITQVTEQPHCCSKKLSNFQESNIWLFSCAAVQC